MSRPDFSSLLDSYVGNGRPVSTAAVAAAFNVSDRTVRRWTNPDDRREPDREELKEFFSADDIPITLKLLVAQGILKRCPQLRVDVCHADEPCASLPMPVTFSVSEVLTRIQRKLDAITAPISPGGRNITPGEAREIDPHVAELQELVSVQLVGAVNACKLNKAG